MIKVQSSWQFQQNVIRTLLKQGSPLAKASGNEPTSRPANAPLSASAGIPLDSLEELGSLFSEKVEKKTKGLNRRQISGSQARSNRKSVERIEGLIELYQILDDEQQERLETRLDAMRSALGQSGEPQADALVEAAEGDPARCKLILEMTQREADLAGDHQLAKAADVGLEKLHEKYDSEIQAGLNTAKAIASVTTDAHEKQQIRNFYYKGIVQHQSAAAILDSLLECYGHDRMENALHTLQRALAEDIAAFAPSIKSKTLHRIRLGLDEASSIGSTINKSDELLSNLRASGKIPVSVLSGTDMARRLLTFAENGMVGRDVKNIGNEFAGEKPAAQMIFFNRLLPMLRQLPLRLWKDMKSREPALNLLRDVINVLVKKENSAANS